MEIRSLAFLFVPLLLLGCGTGERLIPPEQFAKLPAETVDSDDTEIYASIKTRPGITVSFTGLKPQGNLPIVLFFKGGSWTGGFSEDIETAFSSIGLGSIDVGPPSGFSGGVPYQFRETQEHVRDVEAVIRFFRKRYPKNQIWISGTSTGSVSTANVVTNTKEKVDGAVFYSSVSTDKVISPVLYYPIGDLKIPVLAVHHKYDACRNTEPFVAEQIAQAARNAPVAEALLVEGGHGFGNPCRIGHYHGFAGIREEVFKKVGDWILRNSK